MLYTSPTHKHDHTLDLIITRQSDQLLGNTPRISRYISHHATVLCSVRCDKPPLSVRRVSYRKLQSVNVVSLNEDLATSELWQNPSDDLQELVSSYNGTLMATLDKHAPLMTRTIVQRRGLVFHGSVRRSGRRSVSEGRLKRGGGNLDWSPILLLLKQNVILLPVL